MQPPPLSKEAPFYNTETIAELQLVKIRAVRDNAVPRLGSGNSMAEETEALTVNASTPAHLLLDCVF